MKDKRSNYASTARDAAAHIVGGQPNTFQPQRMTKYAHWFEDTNHRYLVAVVHPEEDPKVGTEVMAYGLAWQRNRDLILVLPATMTVEANTRRAWIGTEVRIWQFDGSGVPNPVPAKSRHELLTELRGLKPRQSRKAAITSEHEQWLLEIDRSNLSGHDRSYLSWHHDGLQVLKVSTTKDGLRIQAGVQYGGTTPPPGREPFNKVFSVAPTPGELAVINAKIQLAIEDGGSQTSLQSEHKMQANLATQDAPKRALGLSVLMREFPAWRGMKSPAGSGKGWPGFIDFLGADSEGVLHVVETKIGYDPRVVLQALDYAIWTTANDEAIREQLAADGLMLAVPTGVDPTAAAPIHLVLGSSTKDKAFNAYLASQIEALAGDTKVNVLLTAEPTAPALRLEPIAKGELWVESALVAKPVVEPRWAGEATEALMTTHP